ncbi:MAG: 3-hydroxyacyl-CoA dehydrogenase family protein [Streptosporangiales bacterium]|nr:3-hydroxyacyl-CoA dehydrogenase family protein [Streptosporangiales bacterium]
MTVESGTEIGKVGVIGLGTMGAGIVEVFAGGGLQVVGVEYSLDLVEAGRDRLRHSTERAVRRGKLAADGRQALLDRVTFSSSFDDLADCDLVIEAVSERLELKREIFRRLDEIVGADGILASNTSSLSVTEIATATARPAQVIGMHFFNPAPVQRLVEVVQTVSTSEEVVAAVVALAHRLGKHPVVAGDRAGFIANALLFGYLNRAVTMYENGHVSREDVDTAMRVACGYPMGPLALLDLIGLDTAVEVLATMYRQTGDRLYVASPLLGQLVTAGRLGRKAGRGFYTYESAGSGALVDDARTPVPRSVAHDVTRVGLVGSGAQVKAVGAMLEAAGVEVRRDSTAADCDLVVAAASGVPVIELAVAAGRPSDVVGMNVPMPDSDVVQVVRTVEASDAAVESAASLCLAAGRTPVVSADRAGLVVDALLFPYLNDAARMVESGYTTADGADAAMKLGCALPQGPFEVLEEVGLGVALGKQWAIYDEVREPGLVPSPLLVELVTAGRGFRD